MYNVHTYTINTYYFSMFIFDSAPLVQRTLLVLFCIIRRRNWSTLSSLSMMWGWITIFPSLFRSARQSGESSLFPHCTRAIFHSRRNSPSSRFNIIALIYVTRFTQLKFRRREWSAAKYQRISALSDSRWVTTMYSECNVICNDVFLRTTFVSDA